MVRGSDSCFAFSSKKLRGAAHPSAVARPSPLRGRRKADGVEQPHLELELRPPAT